MSKWAYTEYQGQEPQTFDLSHSDETIAAIENEVQHNGNWGRWQENPYGPGLPVNYTVMTSIPNRELVKTFQVFFPDGRIWDSQARRFIKDPDLWNPNQEKAENKEEEESDDS